MRTTLDIADDVLFAAKDYARRDKKTLGEVISEWGRAALQQTALASKTKTGRSTAASKQATNEAEIDRKFKAMGFKPLPKRGGPPVTNEMINQLRDELGI
jgi:hypothetical protein